MADKSGIKVIANNKKAYHDYFVLEKFECGIELFGTEVKSIRGGNVNLKDSYCYVKNGEVFATGIHILKLFGKVNQDGLTLIPLSVYFENSLVKVELGLCKGKKLYDKRDDEAKNRALRDIERAEKSNGKNVS